MKVETVKLLLVGFILGACLLAGCAKPYAPKELTAEERALKKDLSAYTDNFKTAFADSKPYTLVAIVDRSTKFPDDDQEYARVLVLHRQHLDLDDYGFSLPGKEDSEADEDRVDGFFNDVMFWVDREGNILFDDFEQPPGTEMVVEWCVPKVPGNQVSLHFAGNRCLTIDLNR